MGDRLNQWWNMTIEELMYINTVSRGIDGIERLLDNPGCLRLVKNMDGRYYYNVDGYYSINDDVTSRISAILKSAQRDINSILEQELVKLKSEFSKIEIKTETTEHEVIGNIHDNPGQLKGGEDE